MTFGIMEAFVLQVRGDVPYLLPIPSIPGKTMEEIVGIVNLNRKSFITQANLTTDLTRELPRIIYELDSDEVKQDKRTAILSVHTVSKDQDQCRAMLKRVEQLLYLPFKDAGADGSLITRRLNPSDAIIAVILKKDIDREEFNSDKEIYKRQSSFLLKYIETN